MKPSEIKRILYNEATIVMKDGMAEMSEIIHTLMWFKFTKDQIHALPISIGNMPMKFISVYTKRNVKVYVWMENRHDNWVEGGDRPHFAMTVNDKVVLRGTTENELVHQLFKTPGIYLESAGEK